MDITIKLMTKEDFPSFQGMQTGIENDYVERIYPNLVKGKNRLYGLFAGGQLACVCGYTIFAERYAMIGRIRSDVRFRGKAYATTLTDYIKKEALKLPGIHWVGANTQEQNGPARRVLEKLGFQEQAKLYGATAESVSALAGRSESWEEIKEIERKRQWVDTLYLKTGAVFPYECYYMFPASQNLFTDRQLEKWSFRENRDGTRVLILKKDEKGFTYLHAVYPWDDVMQQDGLWETVDEAYRQLAETAKGETRIWMDLSEEAASSLPENHPFTLPSPWMLYGAQTEET
ncbi:GNAT family N-acetyltransferase [Indiicoccus explosivorum]|uniref:GNAT family N-acetyltransferase n=1 Tax=Indiicoccus explosivorum TaxID=1917864 RepID=UPI000B4400A7|nr:GNAT family N-acetyltransferase [Indiicoccus explosivorum]